jgi:hypothetical protein
MLSRAMMKSWEQLADDLINDNRCRFERCEVASHARKVSCHGEGLAASAGAAQQTSFVIFIKW